MLGLNKDVIRLVKHQKTWKKDFEKEKQQLEKLIGDKVVAIEHVGSTAIPNLKAKPVIDVALGIADISSVPEIKKILSENGYKIKDVWNEELEETFISKGPDGCRTHNLHLEIYGGVNWNSHILFKKYLLNHPEAVKEYENMKLEMADKFQGMEKGRKQYQESKQKVVSGILEKAKKEFGEIKKLK